MINYFCAVDMDDTQKWKNRVKGHMHNKIHNSQTFGVGGVPAGAGAPWGTLFHISEDNSII